MKFKNIIAPVFCLLTSLFWVTPVLAQEQESSGPTTDLETSIEALGFFQKSIGTYITRIVEVALIVGTILVLMYLLWGGIDWIMSGGDKAKYEGARNRITAALMGLAIMASAWALWLLAIHFFGIDKKFDITGQGGGGNGAGRNQCWPFSSCTAWQAQFEAEHGYQPTVGSGQDWIDFQASQDLLERTGEGPSQED